MFGFLDSNSLNLDESKLKAIGQVFLKFVNYWNYALWFSIVPMSLLCGAMAFGAIWLRRSRIQRAVDR